MDFPDPHTPITRHCLSWERPLLAQAVEWLAAGWGGEAPLDLANRLVVVPTRQAGRRLREALARGKAAGPGAAEADGTAALAAVAAGREPLRLRADDAADLRAALKVHRRVCAVMPTGAGKGQTIGAIARGAAGKGRRVLVLAHSGRCILAPLSASFWKRLLPKITLNSL